MSTYNRGSANRILSAVAGDPRRHPLEARLFNTLSLLNALANFGGAFFLSGNNGPLLALQLGFGVAFLLCYLASRNRGYGVRLYATFVGLMLGFVFLNILRNAGTHGGAHYYLIVTVMIAVIVAPDRRKAAVAVAACAVVTALVLGVELWRPAWIHDYAQLAHRIPDVYGNLLFVELLTALLVLVLARNLNQERELSDRLLRNILPDSIADELKRHDRVQPREYAEATVLFTDFVGFTQTAERLSAAELVQALDTAFGEFDAVIRHYGLEKIKTIGDAYLAVAGIPEPRPQHALEAVLAALALRDRIARAATDGRLHGWQVRIGVHTGPLIAGVVGEAKFAYDVWGDTVNTASRMESSGAPGRVNVSAATWSRVADYFDGEERGAVEAKNKGAVEMVFVNDVKVTGALPNGLRRYPGDAPAVRDPESQST